MKQLFALIFFSLSMAAFGQQVNMVRINGGTFTMGSPENETGRYRKEGPQHQVTVSSFYMGKYPVTQAEYLEVMGTNPSHFREGQNRPVERVSWLDAIEYCNRLSIKEGFTPAYSINGNNVIWDLNTNGYRLPTEAEWEYACRAGTETPFYTGTSVDEAGWYKRNSQNRTHPVGEKLPNLWGLYDMHGNVLEWCWDWLGDDYPKEAQTNPQGIPSGLNRVYRGGCWYEEAHNARSAYRFGNKPTLRLHIVGFRIVRSLN